MYRHFFTYDIESIHMFNSLLSRLPIIYTLIDNKCDRKVKKMDKRGKMLKILHSALRMTVMLRDKNTI